jgi:methyl-accepting chemotaxis protein
VRKATAEQVTAAAGMLRSIETMRNGAASTSRALAEQSVAGEQISRSAESLTGLTESVSKSMSEQSIAAGQIAAATDIVRQQTDQASKALAEQARAMKAMTTAVQNNSRQIALISQANREYSAAADMVLNSLTEVRRITDQNGRGGKRNYDDVKSLLARAQSLADLVTDSGTLRKARPESGGNSRADQSRESPPRLKRQSKAIKSKSTKNGNR